MKEVTEKAKKEKTSVKTEAKVVDKITKKTKKNMVFLNGKNSAYVNAGCVSLSIFFGVVAICLGISNLTGWRFDFAPFLYCSAVSSVIYFSILAIVFAVFAFKTVNKITNRDALEKAWKFFQIFFSVFAVLRIVNAVTTIVYSLVGIGNPSVNQTDLWLNEFLTNLVFVLVELLIVVVSRRILSGKTVLVRIFGIVGLVIAVISLLLGFLATFFGFYGGNRVETQQQESQLFNQNYGQDFEENYNNGVFNPMEEYFKNFWGY